MTTNINLAEFEPTDEMKARWPGISDRTTVEMTNARRIDVPGITYRPPTETWTDETDLALTPSFSVERLELISVGDRLCYYWQDSDTLFVRR